MSRGGVSPSPLPTDAEAPGFNASLFSAGSSSAEPGKPRVRKPEQREPPSCFKIGPMSPGALTGERDVREAYAAHAGELYGFARRSLGDAGLAEEAVQETFLRAWRAGERFDPELGSLRTWLFAILRNVVVDLSRARAVRPGLAEGGIEPSVEPLEEALLSWQVEEAMRRIGEQHRRVLVETYYRGRPYAEVAAELGVPEGTVKSRVYYGLRALKVALEEIGYED